MASLASVESLKVLEEMLRDIGGPSPATFAVAAKVGGVVGGAGAKPPLSSLSGGGPASGALFAPRDCLASDGRGQWQVPKLACRTPSPSPLRGASMAGKDRAEKRFYGKGFGLPPQESPGPIYNPESFTDERTSGRSFTHAGRPRVERGDAASTPGPNAYTLPTTVGGRHIESGVSNPPAAAFVRSRRFNAREFISRAHSRGQAATDTPAPTAYQPDVLRLTDWTSHGVAFSGSRTGRAVGVIGADSPGPIYHPEDGVAAGAGGAVPAFVSLRSSQRSSPAFTMAGRTGAGAATVEDVGSDGGGGSVGRPPRPPRGRSAGASGTPGPAAYSPTIAGTRPDPPRIQFPRAASRARVATDDTPGAKYDISDAYTRPNARGASLGASDPEKDAHRPRFEEKVFLGRGMGETRGGASPGPLYNQDYDPKKGPAFTLVHKERTFAHLYPAPSRARCISQETAKENLGAYSPGPKYNVGTKEFGASAPAYTFGTSDREFGPNAQMSPPLRGRIGANDAPATRPSEARFISAIHSRTSRAGRESPGPQNPNVTPNDAACSGTRRAPSVVIAAPVGTPRQRPGTAAGKNDAGAADAPPPDLARTTIVYPDSRAHAFPKAERLVPMKAGGLPGPGAYSPKFETTERRVKGTAIGGLS